MADTFAPGPIQQIDTSQAQAFAQVYAAAAQVGKQVKAQQLQEQAYTVGTQAIQSQLTSQEAVKQALKGELNIANPLAAEAVRGAAYVDAARAIRDDLKEEWQSNASLSEIHPDGFSVWLRKQLPGKMAEYGINTADPDAARYFAPQMEAGFREITNQQNQQYVAYTNRQVRTQFNTQARETIRSFIENRGQDNISPNDMGMLLDQMHSDASALGISGAERDMLMADAITAQALNYASNVDTLDQANLILASADEIRGGRFSKSAPVQDQLRKAKSEVSRLQGQALKQASAAMKDRSGAIADATAKQIQMALDGGNLAQANALQRNLYGNPDVLPEDAVKASTMFSNMVSYRDNLEKLSTVPTDAATYAVAEGELATLSTTGDWGGMTAALARYAESGTISRDDMGRLKKTAMQLANNAQDDNLRDTQRMVLEEIKNLTTVPRNPLGMTDPAQQEAANAKERRLNSLWLRMSGQSYPVEFEGERVEFRSLPPAAQFEVFLERSGKMLEGLNKVENPAQVVTQADLTQAVAKDTAAKQLEADKTTAELLQRQQETQAQKLVIDSKFSSARSLLDTFQWEPTTNTRTDIELVGQDSAFTRARRVRVPKHNYDGQKNNEQLQTQLRWLENVKASGVLQTESQFAIMDEVTDLIYMRANLSNAYGNTVDGTPTASKVPTMEEFNAQTQQMRIPKESWLGSMLMNSGNVAAAYRTREVGEPSPTPEEFSRSIFTEPNTGGLGEILTPVDYRKEKATYIVPKDVDQAIRDAMDLLEKTRP